MTRTLVAVFTSLALCATGALDQTATGSPERHTVSAVPLDRTPDVANGSVDAIAKVKSTIVIGGTFSKLSSAGRPAQLDRSHLASFGAATGVVRRRFAPVLNGPVTSIQPAGGGTVFVAGGFTRVNGRKASHLVKLDLATGRVVRRFHVPRFDDTVNAVVLSHRTLYAGGFFHTVAGRQHGGLVALNPHTGAVRRSVSVQFTGDHGTAVGTTAGRVGLRDLDVSRNGTRLVAVGNFMRAGGRPRPQIAMLSLGKKAAVTRNWATRRFLPACNEHFASYMRGVDFSPTGSYFVVVATGGRTAKPRVLCDSASRWQTHAQGRRLQPRWVDQTGADSLLSVDVTGSAVYVGGHQRWMNNPIGVDQAGPGATPRPGIAALSPVNGLPLRWNPGRNPRGAGAAALLVTSGGLWVGSDTDWIGNFRYRREKIASFPFAGGRTLPHEHLGTLPGDVYQFAPTASSNGTRVNRVAFTGRRITAVNRAKVSGDRTWTGMRGAVMIDKTLFYGSANGMFYRCRFSRAGFGPAVRIDPYHDPAWADVPSGFRNGTYDGKRPGFYRELATVSGMFYWHGRLYYATTDSARLHWRAFAVDSGVVGQRDHTVKGRVDWRETRGIFRSGGTVYFARRSTGRLASIAFRGGRVVGRPSTVRSPAHPRFDWASRGLVVYSG